MEVTLRPIGTVRGGRVDPVDDGWGSEVSTIELDPSRLDAGALAGLDEFSHVEVVYLFHLVDEAEVITGARRPRERLDWPEVGILAQRGRVRPNRLGVSVAKIIEVGSYTVVVRGLDAVDGSPVLDLSPTFGASHPMATSSSLAGRRRSWPAIGTRPRAAPAPERSLVEPERDDPVGADCHCVAERL